MKSALPSISPSREALSNITDISRRRTSSIAQIITVNRPRVILPQRRVDGLATPLIAPVLKITLEMLRTTTNHGRDLVLLFHPVSLALVHMINETAAGMATHLAQRMPPRKPLTPTTLHQPRGRNPPRTNRRNHPDIAMALLHDNRQNHPLIDPQLRALPDGDINPPDIVPRAARRLHRVFVALEQLVEGQPGVDGREVVPGAGDPAGGGHDAEGVGGVFGRDAAVGEEGDGGWGGEGREGGGEEGEEGREGDHFGGGGVVFWGFEVRRKGGEG